MVINLCLPHIQSTIHCSKVCADGYEVSNLLSGNSTLLRRGFRAEYFIRPPVHITLTFPFAADICRVDVELCPAGMDKGQASRGLEILTSSSVSSASSSSHAEGNFRLVGRCMLKEETTICFSQTRFRPRPPFQQCPPLPPGHALIQELWSRGPCSLTAISQLRLTLTYGGGGTPLGLRGLAVWGQPARCCPLEVVERVKAAQQDSLSPPDPLPLPSLSSAFPPTSPPPTPESLPAPEEFLDPLTQELMLQPVLLPGGAVVDSSTLEEYQRREATWGRPPNDPFTGVPFTRHSQPLPHPALKTRIDRFLLHGGGDVGGCSVLGRAGLRELPQPSRLTATTQNRSSDPASLSQSGSSEPANGTADPYHSLSLNSAHPGEMPHSRETASRDSKSTVSNLCKWRCFKNQACPASEAAREVVEPSESPHCSAQTGPPAKKRKTASHTANPGLSSHEQRLSESLDSALSSALRAFPSFTIQRGVREGEPQAGVSLSDQASVSVRSCCLCSCSLSVYPGSPAAFLLPCTHLLCRSCLAQRPSHMHSCPPTPTLLCPHCGASVKRGQITRVHY